MQEYDAHYYHGFMGWEIQVCKTWPTKESPICLPKSKKERSKGKPRSSTGCLAINDISLPEGWMGECIPHDFNVFSRKEKKMTLELSVEFPRLLMQSIAFDPMVVKPM